MTNLLHKNLFILPKTVVLKCNNYSCIFNRCMESERFHYQSKISSKIKTLNRIPTAVSIVQYQQLKYMEKGKCLGSKQGLIIIQPFKNSVIKEFLVCRTFRCINYTNLARFGSNQRQNTELWVSSYIHSRFFPISNNCGKP